MVCIGPGKGSGPRKGLGVERQVVFRLPTLFRSPFRSFSEREVPNHIQPFPRFGSLGHQLQVLDELPNGPTQLVSKEHARERFRPPVLVLRQGREADVLGEYHAAERTGTLQEFVVLPCPLAILDGGEHVDPAAT
jgi:hypothetical protein